MSTDDHREMQRAAGGTLGRLRDRRSALGTELEQALLRLLIVVAASVYLGWIVPRAPDTAPMLLAAAGLVWLAALGLLAMALLRPRPSAARRTFAIGCDTAAITVGLLIAGPLGPPLYPLYLLVALGNGLRFGPGPLYLATALSLLGFSVTASHSPYWSSQLPLSVGLLLGLALVPLYAATLLRYQRLRTERAEAAQQSHQLLLSDLTEELREPLHGITGMSDLLRETPLDQEQREYADAISRAAGTLMAMAGNLDDYARIERNQFDSSPIDFDLHTLLNGLLRTLRPRAQDKNLQMDLHVDPEMPYRLHGDAAHLRQILTNLVLDAVRLTRLGGVSVSASLHRDTDRQVQLRFEIEASCSTLAASNPTSLDPSPDAADAPLAPSSANGFRPRLAVAIARRLIVAMGGTVEPVTATARGSLIAFQLPFERQQGDPERDTGLERTRVLVISDEGSENLSRLQEWLRLWHAQTDIVETASAAFMRAEIEARRGDAYHAVVIDKPLIDLDTRQFARALRRVSLSSQTALVLITPPEQVAHRDSLLEAGYTCVLSSPVDKRLLFNALHSAPVAEPGRGASRVVELRSRMSPQHNAARARILIAEDNPTQQKFITRALNSAGHEVELVSNGEEALDALEVSDYDLVVIDMHLPVMDGVQAVKLFRFIHPDRTHMPFVMLTANTTADARMECEAAGIEHFVAKPVDAERLLGVVHELLQRAKGAGPNTDRDVPRVRALTTGGDSPVLNLASLQEVQDLGYGSEFFHELVQGFIRDGNAALEKIEDAVSREDYADFRDASQALKGNAGTIGAVKLYKCCQQPERMSRPDFELMASQLASDIGTEFRRACSALIEYSKLLGNNARN